MESSPSVSSSVAMAKRHKHTHSGQQRHLLRHAVGIGLVNGKNRRRNGNLRNHALLAHLCGQLALGDLADGQRDGLVLERNVEGLGLDGI